MLLSEIQYNANGTQIRTLKFCYDEKGSPIGFVHIDASGAVSYYYYAKNLQGDVVALYLWNWSNEGKHSVTLVATYNYDPWGKLLSVKNASGSTISSTLTTNIANVNPFRYRGYYYDTETGFYYLQSRYYDPTISRFINADEYASTGQDFLGCNMFAYCGNNSVNSTDPTGHFGLFGLAAAVITAGAVVGGLLGAFNAAATGGNVLEGAVEGFINGAIGATCGILIPNPVVAVTVATVASAAVDLGTQIATQYIDKGDVDFREVDYGRVVKTGLETGLGTAIPAYGTGAGNAVDTFGTALIWGEGSALITCADVAVTNAITAWKSDRKKKSAELTKWGSVAFNQRRELLI